MFALRTAACAVLGRGIRPGPGLASTGRQAATAWCGETKSLAAGANLLPVCRTYSTNKATGQPSQLDDLPPAMFKKEYQGINPEGVNDVVKRLLSLGMASQADKLQIKIQQLVAKVKISSDASSIAETRIAVLTARIENFKEHLQNHPHDKSNKRLMLMSIDRRKKILKVLRRTRYDSFEHVCTQLGIEYTFPPEYYRRATKRWVAKKAFCLQVYKEAKKLKEKENLQNIPKANPPLYVFPQPTN